MLPAVSICISGLCLLLFRFLWLFVGDILEPEFLRMLVDNSVSLAVLLAVLFGIYKLTSKFLGLFLGQVDDVVGELKRIADALNGKKEQ